MVDRIAPGFYTTLDSDVIVAYSLLCMQQESGQFAMQYGY